LYLSRYAKARNKLARITNKAAGSPSGARMEWTKSMFTLIGNRTTLASGTKKAEIKQRPQRSSRVFTTGIMYPDAASPSLNSFIAPCVSGCGIKLKKYEIDANRRSKASKLLIIITAIFIKNKV